MISEKNGEKSMGGYGSGRPSYNKKAEDCRSIDINRLKRDGCLRDGWSGNWVWSENDKEVGRIGMRAKERLFVLNYRVSQYGGEWQVVEQSIRLAQAACHYGGQRPYFWCPGVVNGKHCGRRVGKLFLSGRYFLCRHCHRLAYTSQSEPRHDRMLRRANKLRTALGGRAGTAHWIAPKPKRKRFEIEWCENKANQLFLSKFSHLLSEYEREFLLEC
jgi:hypothetical protein